MVINIPVIGLTAHGGNRVLIQLANYFSQNGCVVNIYYPAGLKSNIPYEILSSVNVHSLGINVGSRILNIILFFFVFFVKMFNKKSIIIANHFLTFYPAVICSFVNNKHYYFVQDIESEFCNAKKNILWKIAARLCELTYKSDRIISANKYLTSRLLKFNSDIMYQFNLGVDDVFFRIPNVQIEKIYDFVYFPRPEAHKGLYRFNELIHRAEIRKKQPKILLIGQKFSFLSKPPYGIHLTCVSPRDDMEMISFLDQAKCLLLTSLHEGFSLPPLEAMARGIPSIMFNCGGPNVYVNNKNAIVVNDQYEFIEKVREFLDNKISIFEASACVETAYQYSMTTEMNRLLEFLKSK